MRDFYSRGRGAAPRPPLWRALIELELAAEEHDGDDEEACEAEAQRLVAALTPPDWIAVKADLLPEVYRSTGPRDGDFDPARVPADVGPWAAAMAERLTEQHAPGAPASERGGHSEPPYPLTWMVFLGLVRGGVSVEPRWDWLCPVAGGALEAASDECLGALPAARRDAAIVRGLAAMFPRDALRTGAAMLARYPSLALVDHLIARAATAHGSLLCPPRRAYLPGLAAALAAHPALVAHLDAHLAYFFCARRCSETRVRCSSFWRCRRLFVTATKYKILGAKRRVLGENSSLPENSGTAGRCRFGYGEARRYWYRSATWHCSFKNLVGPRSAILSAFARLRIT